MSRARVGVLISGRGSNMSALIEAAKDPAYPAEIVAVISNNPDAPGLEIARGSGVEALAVDHRPFGKDRAAHEAALDAALRERGVEWVALAGYMRVLTPFFVRAWSGRMLNIHPSLLPAFPGLDTHRRALEAAATEHGCTVHLVTAASRARRWVSRPGSRSCPTTPRRIWPPACSCWSTASIPSVSRGW
jgi:phosphoribosylglycinamide formyltransferase-1